MLPDDEHYVYRGIGGVDVLLKRTSMMCLILAALLTSSWALAAQNNLPFGEDLELNLKIYNQLVEDKNSNIESLTKFTLELIAVSKKIKKPVTEAYIRFQYANRLKGLKRQTEALDQLESALDILAALETDKPENGLKPRPLYKKVLKAAFDTAKTTVADIDQWVAEYIARPDSSKNLFYSDGLNILKRFYADHLFDKGQFAEAKTVYEELLVAFPRDKHFSVIKDKLNVIAKKLRTDRYQKLSKRRRSALITCPFVAVGVMILLWLTARKWPKICIFTKPKTDTEKTYNDAEEKFSPPFLNYNDPLAYLVLRVWRPAFLKMFFSAFCIMFLLHFVVALVDNNLYYEQKGAFNAISELASREFHKPWRTFSTIPRGYEPHQKEYFFNDYYGFIINGLINPLIFVAVFAIYRQFEKLWRTLFSQDVIIPSDEDVRNEINRYLLRTLNKRWHFWLSLLVSLLFTFSVWYAVSNQPDRASYLDFDEGIMPIYHGLYLCIIWYMLIMMALKTLTSIGVFHKIFNVYPRQAKVQIHLKPLHPDRCCGMSSVGRYALLVHLLVFLVGIMVSARVFFDFVLIGTPLYKQPLLLAGISAFLPIALILFFAPLYIVRGRMMSVKNGMLEELNKEHAAQQEKFLRMLREDNMDRQQVEYMQKLAEIHAQIKSIPSWPFDLRTLSTFAGTLFLPIILPLITQFLLDLFL